MPKIGKEYVTVRDKYIEVEIWYGRKDGFYYKGLPEDLYNITQFGSRKYESESELKNHLLYMLTDYHEKIKQTRKVIVYCLYGSTKLIMNKAPNGGWTGRVQGVSTDIVTPGFGSDAPDYMFGFSYNICIEISSNITEYFSVGENDTPELPKYRISNNTWKVIEWTPEREKFFEDLKANLLQLTRGVSAFFGQPDLLELMDTHGIKMLGAR